MSAGRRLPKSRRYIPALLTVGCVVLSVGLAPTSAFAAVPPTAIGPAVVPSEPQILGQPYIEDQILDWVNSFNIVVDRVRTDYPDHFAGAEAAQIPPVVMFAGAPPDGALQILEEGLDIPYTVRTDLAVSERELHAATEATHYALLESVPAGTGLATEPDVDSATITATVALPVENLDTPQERADFLEPAGDLAAARRSGGIQLQVVADPTLETSSESYGAAGGVRLNGSGGAFCTSGFVVKLRTGPDLGVLTAGHCPNNLTQNGTYSFNFRAEHQGADGDIQWMRSPQMMDAWFHYDHGVGLPAQRTAVASLGQQIYKYGVTTGRTTSTVRATGVCLNSACNLVSTDVQISDSGDSGGPWYIGTSAYGTHVGSSWTIFSSSSYYSPIGRTLSRFGLNLCLDINGGPIC